MLILGIFCILYYMVIRVYTGRKDSTFLPFWIFMGIFCLACHVILINCPVEIRRLLQGLLLLCFLMFLAGEVRILWAAGKQPDKDLEVLIVLGAQVRGIRVTNSLKHRLDRACAYLKEHPKTVAILSGGQGRGEDISEASAMNDYLLECGIEQARLLMEDKSTTTWENLKFSFGLYGADFLNSDLHEKKVGIVTNDFHVCRALMMAKKQGYKKVQGVPASSNPVLFLNYLVREFFACAQTLLYYRKR